jgi:hypothetical protein
MCFTIKHFRDGACLGVADHAMTMYAARSTARARQIDLQSNAAVILGRRANGEETEVELLDFANQGI